MATAASPKVTKKKPAPSHPTYFEMAKDAVISLAQSKGSSVQSIRAYIVERYDISADVVRVHLKPALAKGIENGTFIRPVSSDAKGYTGRFKINKTKLAEETKEAARKEKKKIAEKKTAEDKATKPKSSKPKSSAGATRKVVKKPSDGIKKTPKKTPTTVTKRKIATPKPGPKSKVLKTPKQSKTASKLGRKKNAAA